MRHSLAWISILCVSIGLGSAERLSAQRQVVRVPEAPSVPLQVLCRSGAELYENVSAEGKDAHGEKIVDNPALFKRYYVYEAPASMLSKVSTDKEGWFLVGEGRDGKLAGWLKADHVVPWKHRMVMSFAPKGDPAALEKREKVLMFKEGKELVQLVKSASRSADAESIYAAVNGGKIPENLTLVAVEPEMEVDIGKEFYLVPIIEHMAVDLGGEDAYLLKIACATRGDSGEDKNTTQLDATELQQTLRDEGGVDKKVLSQLGIDIVFVVDTTASMQPFIQKTLETVNDIASVITQDASLKDKVRFGIWGYKDSDRESPYVSKNFTPTLQAVTEFEATLAGVKEGGGGDLPEDVYAGIADAITQTSWTAGPDGARGSLRFLILVGDAPAQVGDKTKSGQSAETLNVLAQELGASIFALHIINPRMKEHRDQRIRDLVPLAESQFRVLSEVSGLQLAESAYFPVGSPEDFGSAAKAIAENLVGVVKAATDGSLVAETKPSETKPSETKPDAGSVAKAVARTAAMRWIGSRAGVEAPSDVLAWVSDRDLRIPELESVEPRVLLTRAELSALQTQIGDIVKAVRDGEMTGESFHKAIREKTGGAIMDASLSDLMQLLPYKSEVLLTTEQKWESMGPGERSEFLQTLVEKMQAYQRVAESPDLWVPINTGDDASDHCYPLPLHLLP